MCGLSGKYMCIFFVTNGKPIFKFKSTIIGNKESRAKPRHLLLKYSFFPNRFSRRSKFETLIFLSLSVLKKTGFFPLLHSVSIWTESRLSIFLPLFYFSSLSWLTWMTWSREKERELKFVCSLLKAHITSLLLQFNGRRVRCVNWTSLEWERDKEPLVQYTIFI